MGWRLSGVKTLGPSPASRALPSFLRSNFSLKVKFDLDVSMQHGPLMWRKCFNQSYEGHKNSEHSLHKGTRYTLHPPPTPPLLLPWGPSQERTTLTTNNITFASKLPWGRFGAATVFKYYVCVGLNNPTVRLPRRCVYRTAARLTFMTLLVTTVTCQSARLPHQHSSWHIGHCVFIWKQLRAD